MAVEIALQEKNLDQKWWEICQEAHVDLIATKDTLDFASPEASVLVSYWNKLFPSLIFAMCLLIIIVNTNFFCSLSSLVVYSFLLQFHLIIGASVLLPRMPDKYYLSIFISKVKLSVYFIYKFYFAE